MTRSPSWRTFEARHPGWTAQWNEITRTPHRAFGPSFALPGFANDPVSADRAVRAFIAGHPELFGGGGIELQSVSSSQHGAVWYVRLRQIVNGLPVLFSDWEFRVGTNGHLMLFGADPRGVPSSLSAGARIAAPVAREAAHFGMAFDPLSDRVNLDAGMAYAPTSRADGSADLRLVYDATVLTARPGSSERVLVDAGNGEVLWRNALRDDAVTGSITAQVHTTSAYDPLSTRTFRSAAVGAGSASAVTDTNGAYSIEAPSYPTTVTSAFVGPYCHVFRQDGTADAGFSKTNTANSSLVNVAWTDLNSQASERDAFYHVNVAHDWVKAIDPGFVAIDYPLTVNVNWNDGLDCEAYWDQASNTLNFWASGATCPNTATVPDLTWHEYSHVVNYNLYFTHGSATGLQNKALGEGLADAFTVLLGDEPLVGNGFTGPGTYIRDVRRQAHYPEDVSTDVHVTGMILAGALWDFKLGTNGAVASRLMHLAKYGLPDDPDIGVAMSEFFLDMLIADDDDGDLGNGTPSLVPMNAAFSAHGIGMNYYLNVTHAALDDQATNGPYPINATITYGGPIGGLGASSLHYSVNGTPMASKSLLPTGNPDEFSAEIPGQSYGIVSYYLIIKDSYGDTLTMPAGAPARGTYQFLAGPATTLASNDCEAPDGWTVGFTGDAATSGLWVRAVPVSSIAQPGEDHTPAGTTCWVTGNAGPLDPPGLNDVDDGKTTLVTSTFSATGGGLIHPVISYWRWTSNNAGDAAGEDPWRTYISNNNGATWALVENTVVSSNAWQRVMFFISTYVTPTSTMKMRFVAQDTLTPSLVEAAVDDWSMLGYSTLGVPTPTSGAELALQPLWPNPARGDAHVRFSLPAAGRVEIGVYDLEGRKVRTVLAGDRPAGSQSAVWDGRDGSGHRVRPGPYFIRLSRGGDVLSRAVVLLR